MSEPFIGEIRAFGFSFAPRGWASCEGQLLPISENTALFSLIGTYFGGDGRTTLGLPNMAGCVPLHAGRGPALTSRILGDKNGYESIPLTESQMPIHSHTTSIANKATTKVYAETATSDDPSGRYFGKPSTNIYINTGRTSTSMAEDAISVGTSVEIGYAGGINAHSNMQPYLAVNYCIALVGLYPSRS